MGRASLPSRPPTYSISVTVPPIIDEEPSNVDVESTLPLLPSLPTRERPPSASRLKKRFFTWDSTACLSWRNDFASDTACFFQASIELNGFPSWMHVLPRMSLATNRTSLLSVSGSGQQQQGQNLVTTLDRASTVSVASNNPFEFEDDSEDEEKWGYFWSAALGAKHCSFFFECGALKVGRLVLDWVWDLQLCGSIGEAGCPAPHSIPIVLPRACRDSSAVTVHTAWGPITTPWRCITT